MAGDTKAHDYSLNEPLTRCREEGVIYAVLCQDTGGVRAVPLQEGFFFDPAALRAGEARLLQWGLLGLCCRIASNCVLWRLLAISQGA